MILSHLILHHEMICRILGQQATNKHFSLHLVDFRRWKEPVARFFFIQRPAPPPSDAHRKWYINLHLRLKVCTTHIIACRWGIDLISCPLKWQLIDDIANIQHYVSPFILMKIALIFLTNSPLIEGDQTPNPIIHLFIAFFFRNKDCGWRRRWLSVPWIRNPKRIGILY